MHCPRRSERARADDGAVTVEAALALGTLVLVAAAAVAAVAAVATSVRCADAARELVRQAARGDADRGRLAAAALAPTGADTELRFDGDAVVATVTARPAWPLPIRITGSSTAVTEPGLTTGGAPAPAGGTGAVEEDGAGRGEPPGGAQADPDDGPAGDPPAPPARDVHPVVPAPGPADPGADAGAGAGAGVGAEAGSRGAEAPGNGR